MAAKPSGFDKFADALRVVASVPKEQADARVAAQKKARMRKRRKKK